MSSTIPLQNKQKAANTSSFVPHQISSLQHACNQAGIAYEVLDNFSKQLLRVYYANKQYIFGAGGIASFPINSATSTQLVNDKSHTINVLQQAGYRVPEGNYFFTQDSYKGFRGEGKEWQDGFAYANAQGYPLFIKPNNGSQGAYVEKLFCDDDLKHYLHKHSHQFYCFRLEKPLLGKEYRLFVVDGRIWFGYERQAPFVTFNGTQTVRECLTEQLLEQQQFGLSNIDLDGAFIGKQLVAAGLSLDAVPNAASTFTFSPAMNIAIGGVVANYSEQFPEHLHEFVRGITELFNLRVFGIDVYTETDITQEKSPAILEINGNPSFQSAIEHSPSDIVTKLWLYVLEETFK